MSDKKKAPRGLGIALDSLTTDKPQVSSQQSAQQSHEQNSASPVSQVNNAHVDIENTRAYKEMIKGEKPIVAQGKRRVGVSRKYNTDVVVTSISIPVPVHDLLAEITFRNRKTTKDSLNDLVLQGLDAVFQNYGLPTIDQVVEEHNSKK